MGLTRCKNGLQKLHGGPQHGAWAHKGQRGLWCINHPVCLSFCLSFCLFDLHFRMGVNLDLSQAWMVAQSRSNEFFYYGTSFGRVHISHVLGITHKHHGMDRDCCIFRQEVQRIYVRYYADAKNGFVPVAFHLLCNYIPRELSTCILPSHWVVSFGSHNRDTHDFSACVMSDADGPEGHKTYKPKKPFF